MKLNFNNALYIQESQCWKNLVQDSTSLVSIEDNKDQVCTKSWYTPFALSVAIFGTLMTICLIYMMSASSQDAILNKVIACYYNTPSTSKNGSQELLPTQIPPHLCTHINVAFARIVDNQIYLEPAQQEAVREVVDLKQVNPQLKVLLSVGGAGQNNGFSEMVHNHSSRKVFIKSIKSTLRNHSLDGIDLDWEFPALHVQGNDLAGRERQHFSQLLREIRAEYVRENREYLLTVAVAAPQVIVDVSYDVDQINLYVDFVNIMTYDFHYYSKFTPFTGLNSPLYARAGEHLYPATLNVNYTVGMYSARGLDAARTVVGIPTYGHSFRLVSARNTGVGSPASGVGALGGGGFVDYEQACGFVARGAAVRWERGARVPYASAAREWLSYETPRSVAAKARFVAERELRGACIYSLNSDDHSARCGAQRPFPLTHAVRRVLLPSL